MDLSKIQNVSNLIAQLKKCDSPTTFKLSGTWGSFAPCLASYISAQLKQPILYLSSTIEFADNAADDISTFAGKPAHTLPAWETEPDLTDATDEIGTERLRVTMGAFSLKESKKSSKNEIISAPIQAICQPVPKPQKLFQHSLSLKSAQTIEPELVVKWLIDAGFERVERVDMPGQFASRGGIIDVFSTVIVEKRTKSDLSAAPSDFTKPIRIEFFGDEIESLRTIDLDSQRSSEEIKTAEIISPNTGQKQSEKTIFLDMLPENTLIFLEEPLNIQENTEIFLNRLDNPDNMFSWTKIHKKLQKFTRIEISKFAQGLTETDQENCLDMSIKSVQEYTQKNSPIWKSNKSALETLQKEAKNGKKIHFFCEKDAEISRMKEIFRENSWPIPKNFKLKKGYINRGFRIEQIDTIVITHHEIFAQHAIRRRLRSLRPTAPIDNFIDLKKGDYIVHITYGIGKFKGISSITKNGTTTEYLTIEYADNMIIHVPVVNIALVHKYIGSGPSRPPLNKIGTKKWENQKQRVAKSIQDLASQLLETQANREKLGGIEFEKDDNWQKEFEDSFPYQETTDQIEVIHDVKADMQSKRSMDRLLCGDVGFGKTEIAMRAAFKAVQSGKQVAMLVPTTVLCVQHGRSFAERFADFPITIETANRFKTASQVKEIVEKLSQGKIDILIGTHRILSKDIAFQDLGLLIIDEEQRFGVEHKEELKNFRVNLDVLTMTATPIPRTLHMSMLGLRDISSLASPPLDRRSVTTSVSRYSPDLIKNAIMREVNRQGQVFFLHNRVQSIEQKAQEIQDLLPDIRIAIAHGQMPKRKLESAMIKFVNGQIDVLICSTIIESGLDIPNANTIIINNADRFGLAQLHQLRGRVGRYKHRAFAYLLLPADRPITPIAAKRLKAIEEYSHLGAGFKIALRDLEIRGAGNILGPEQSGHINTIGYEMYCKLLNNAVKTLKNEPIEKHHETVLNLGFSSYIPRNYIPSDRQRMDAYRKIALASSSKDLKEIEGEFKDIFGPIPNEVQLLIELTEIRIMATEYKIQSIITASNKELVFSFPKGENKLINSAGDLFAHAPGKIKIPDPFTIHLQLNNNYFEPPTLLAVLRKLFRHGSKKRV